MTGPRFTIRPLRCGWSIETAERLFLASAVSVHGPITKMVFGERLKRIETEAQVTFQPLAARRFQ